MGVPAPAGAYLTILPLIFWLATGCEFFRCPIFVSIFLILSGVMMASKIPTLCLKHLHIPTAYASVLLIVAMLTLAGLIALPWLTLSLVGVFYLLSIPVCIFYFLKFKKNA